MNEMWENEKTRTYLGDGVYAAFDGFSIYLRINDHRDDSHEICLEPEVLTALNNFNARMHPRG
jgi:hypothetical protein